MRKNKIRILHVAQAAGGVDRYIRMLLKYLDKEKFENANNDSLFSFITVQQQAVKFGVCRGRRMFKTVEQKLIRGNG